VSYFYAELREYFNPLDAYKERVAKLEESVKAEKFKHLLTSYEFHDFRAHVGTILPNAIKEKGPGEKAYPLRSLASVVQRRTNEVLVVARAKNIFEQGKTYFRQKNYELAAQQFQLVVKDHPYSAHVAEALFLLVESYYLTRQFENCVMAANKMIDVYPEFELTGYAMLRLGKVYEYQERHEEAIEIYKTVMKAFPSRDIASQANNSLRSVEL
jgi:TolA-binding protein